MLELEFSLIGEPTTALQQLLEAFQAECSVAVHLKTTTWQQAWSELLTYALYDRGPDVSQVGSTWVSSLIGMNALRSFSEKEIRGMGGAGLFLPQCWQSGMMFGDSTVWSVPWSAYTFIICYRRDILQKAGIVEEGAFKTADALARTLTQLKAAGVECPWVVPVNPSHQDTLHYIASWIWGAGGDLVSADGARLLFTQPLALSGAQAYFDLLRYLSSDAFYLDDVHAEEYFLSGRAAVTIAGAEMPYSWLRNRVGSPEVLDNLGYALMPGVPWIGGDNLVVWKHTRFAVEREQAALALVDFLLKQSSQQVYCQGEEVFLPTRPDVFPALPMQGSLLAQTAIHSLQSGRAYHPMPMWSKIEHQSALTLGKIGEDVLAGKESGASIHRHLDMLARRLEISLEQ